MTDATGTPVSLSFPFRRGADGKVVTDPQNTPAHHMTQVQTVVRFPVGFRLDRPTFGITFPEFRDAPLDASVIAAQVRRQVPDADIGYAEFADAVDEATRHIRLDVGG